MLQFTIKILVLFVLATINYQDFKERKVYVGLFLLAFCMLTFLHYSEVNTIQFYTAIAINGSIVLSIMGVLYLYSKWVLKLEFKEAIGVGDFFFFAIIACAFPTGSFLVIFSSSLIGALCLFMIVKNKLKDKTIPLAGLQALFLGLLLITNWIFNFTNLYLI
ncbi:hypothetical protein EC396_14350 [Lutibacter sp. HS1-25]|uniref:prepilin peptidase n=1 Tax=Lutibacter sp. HS1-25 TaxID=2485000 RepID=UPI001012F260|nr:prepilin peptidase [Lutibacter sp. HS1-25]RXP46187.1 hypothetical protein EC396_14350 [Lutibacter sp. HS1-25]